MTIHVGITDDHQLFLKPLALLIGSFPSFQVSIEARNGEELLKKLALSSTLPDIVLIDVDMPVMDGFSTARQVAHQYPQIRLVALSMKDDDLTIIGMIKLGCCAYLLKDTHPDELERALREIYAKGYYNADACNVNYRRLIVHSQSETASALTQRESEFLQLACSDLTYRQIAGEMHLSERTIDGYRESIFEKFNVQSRVGMVLEGLRKKIIHL